jgi:O-antigen ligase
MVLPLVLALLFYNVGRGADRGHARRKGAWRRRAAFIGSTKGHAALIYGAMAVLLLLAIIFSRSRSGIALAMLTIVISAVLFGWRIGGNNVFGPAGTIAALTLSFGVAIGLAPVLQRFSVGAFQQANRPAVFDSALQGAGTLFPFGGRPGTFPFAFPPFRPVELGHFFVNRAHNDFIQWFFDAGVLGIAIPLLFVVVYLLQWTRVYTRGHWS